MYDFLRQDSFYDFIPKTIDSYTKYNKICTKNSTNYYVHDDTKSNDERYDANSISIETGELPTPFKFTETKLATTDGIPVTSKTKALRFTAEGKLLIASRDRIQVINFPHMKIENTIKETPQSIAVNPNDPNTFCAFVNSDGNQDGCIKMFDIRTSQSVHTMSPKKDKRHKWLLNSWSPDGRYIVALDLEENLYFYDICRPSNTTKSKQLTSKMLHSNIPGSNAYSMTFSADSRFLHIGRYSGSIDTYDLSASLTESAQSSHSLTGAAFSFKAHSHIASALATDPLGKRLASAGADRSLILIDSDDFVPEALLPTFPAQISSLSFSHDGEFLLCGLKDSKVSPMPFDEVPTQPKPSRANREGEHVGLMVFGTDPAMLISVHLTLTHVLDVRWHPSRNVACFACDYDRMPSTSFQHDGRGSRGHPIGILEFRN